MPNVIITPRERMAAEITALEDLSDLLDRERYVTTLVQGVGVHPYLSVTDRRAKALCERVYCDGAWFWWGWAERIAPVADLGKAAGIIRNVLRIVGPSS